MFRRITATTTLVALVLVSLAPAATFAAPAAKQSNHQQGRRIEKLAPEFDVAANSAATVRVLIQTKGQPNASLDGAVQNARGQKRASLNAVSTVVADVPANQVASLALRDDVVYVSPDRPVKGTGSLTNDTVGATQVQTSKANAGATGKGVGIAILDSGISANH